MMRTVLANYNYESLMEPAAITSKVETICSVKSQALVEIPQEHEEERDETEKAEQIQQIAVVLKSIHQNDPHGLKRFFASFKNKERIKELVNERDDTGKSPLDIAACLERVEITKMLIAYGAKIDSFTSKGYTCMHYAAAWGKLRTLKLLVESGGNINKKNIHGEVPIDMAFRYSQYDCVEYLAVTVEKKKLQAEITFIVDKMKDIDKIAAGRISKDEKHLIMSMCAEKQEWLDLSIASSLEIKSQYSILIQTVHPILGKVIEIRSISSKPGLSGVSM